MLRKVIVFIVSFLWLTYANANSIQLSIATWQLDDLNASDISIDLALSADGVDVIAKAENVTLPSPINTVSDVIIHCKELEWIRSQATCKRGEFAFYHPTIGQQKLQFQIVAETAQQRYQVSIKNLIMASTKLEATMKLTDDRWQLNLIMPNTSYDSLKQIAASFLSNDQLKPLAEWQFSSHLAINAHFLGIGQQLNNVKMDVAISELTGGNNLGNFVTEDLSSRIHITLNKRGKTWLWRAGLELLKGQGYGEPVFVDMAENPIDIQSRGTWQSHSNRLEISDLDFKQKGVLQGQAQLVMQSDTLESLTIDIGQTDITPVYTTWLQPFFVGTAADTVSVDGAIKIRYQQKQDNYLIKLAMKDVSLDDENKRFGVSDLNGNVAWTSFTEAKYSDLRWQNAYLYAIPIGETEFKAQVVNSKLTLLAPLVVPILDGELQIASLELENNEKTEWAFEGLLTPISMESLSNALNWPLLHGKLSGVIPQLSYKEQKIKVDGALMVKLFEGTSIIRDLRLNKPFGSLPQLYANIDLVNLDLETLTETFEFGKITGKLDGKINNLRLSNWQPVHFDAQFSSSDTSNTKKRISQQAVNNLSQVGGGAGGVLSRSFLRFFEDFSYQRIGLSCKLRNEICEMSGVGETNGGYYIVKGGGLPPRINVIGHTRRVDWPELIARLKAVSKSSGPVVQ